MKIRDIICTISGVEQHKLGVLILDIFIYRDYKTNVHFGPVTVYALDRSDYFITLGLSHPCRPIQGKYLVGNILYSTN